MTNFKTLTTLTIAALFVAPVFAQDASEDAMMEKAPDVVMSNFTASDLDQDGGLNADEFVTFAVMQSEAGNQIMQDLVLGGQYHSAFNAHDKDASGTLSLDELGHKGHASEQESTGEVSGEVSGETSDDLAKDLAGEAPSDTPVYN